MILFRPLGSFLVGAAQSLASPTFLQAIQNN